MKRHVLKNLSAGGRVNPDIAWFKFLYAWVIVIYHMSPPGQRLIPSGYYAVEYYLLVSGVFLFRSFEKQRQNGLMPPDRWFQHRFARLFPGAFTAFLFAAAVFRWDSLGTASPGKLMDYLAGDIWEILLVKWNGMGTGDLLNYPAWTISAMLLAGFFLWGMLYFDEKRFLNLWMPLSLMVGYGVWRHMEYAGIDVWMGVFLFGTFRAYLTMCLGWYCLQLSRFLGRMNLNRRGELLLTAAEILCHGMALMIMVKRDTRNYQWVTTLLFVLAVAVALSGKSGLCRLLSRWRGIAVLQDAGMSVYLIHAGTIALYQRWFGTVQKTMESILGVMGCVLAASILHMILTGCAVSVFRMAMKK